MNWYLGALWNRRLISSKPKRHQHCNWAKNWSQWILLSLTTDYPLFTSLSHPIFTFVIIVLFCFPSRLFLHDDVHEGLNDVRRKAVEDMKKLREKSGTLKGWFQVRFLWHDHVTFSLLLIVTSKSEIIFQPKCRLVYQREQSSVKIVFNAKAMTGNLAASCSPLNWVTVSHFEVKFQHVFFITEESEAASRQVLAKSEQIRRFQEENKHLGQLVTNPSPQRLCNFLFYLFSTDVKRSKFENTCVSSYNSCFQERHQFVLIDSG